MSEKNKSAFNLYMSRWQLTEFLFPGCLSDRFQVESEKLIKKKKPYYFMHFECFLLYENVKRKVSNEPKQILDGYNMGLHWQICDNFHPFHNF